jgi:hypothetical protein
MNENAAEEEHAAAASHEPADRKFPATGHPGPSLLTLEMSVANRFSA